MQQTEYLYRSHVQDYWRYSTESYSNCFYKPFHVLVLLYYHHTLLYYHHLQSYFSSYNNRYLATPSPPISHLTTAHSEVSERLQEINDVKAALADAQTSIQRKEQEILKIHKMVSV